MHAACMTIDTAGVKLHDDRPIAFPEYHNESSAVATDASVHTIQPASIRLIAFALSPKLVQSHIPTHSAKGATTTPQIMMVLPGSVCARYTVSLTKSHTREDAHAHIFATQPTILIHEQNEDLVGKQQSHLASLKGHTQLLW